MINILIYAIIHILIYVFEEDFKQMINALKLSNINNTILILTENDNLPISLSSLKEDAKFVTNFTIPTSSTTLSGWIFVIEGLDNELVRSPLYESLDLEKELKRHLVLEWKNDIGYFSCYSSSNKAFDDKKVTLNERDTFLYALDSSTKDLELVKSWFSDILSIDNQDTENFINFVSDNGLSDYFM